MAAPDDSTLITVNGSTNLTGSGSRPPASFGVTLNDTGFGEKSSLSAARIPSATKGHLVRLYSQFSQLTSGACGGRSRPRRLSSAVIRMSQIDIDHQCARK